jgi:hypothetical protein
MPNKEHESHPTPRMTATCELAAWLCSASIPFALEAFSSNEDGTNNVSYGGVAPRPCIPPPVDAFLQHGEGRQDGVHPALGSNGSGSGNGAYGEEIGMIRMSD